MVLGHPKWWTQQSFEASMFRWIANPGVVAPAILWACIPQWQASAEVIAVTTPFVSPAGIYVTQPDRYGAITFFRFDVAALEAGAANR
jgi:hypothetical protein